MSILPNSAASGVRSPAHCHRQVASFRNFADYALTPPFAAGLTQLRELGVRHRCAITCAEAVWWRRHRRIIADYLIAAGREGCCTSSGPSTSMPPA
jgi:uncharacterized protein (DUF488 family)